MVGIEKKEKLEPNYSFGYNATQKAETKDKINHVKQVWNGSRRKLVYQNCFSVSRAATDLNELRVCGKRGDLEYDCYPQKVQ